MPIRFTHLFIFVIALVISASLPVHAMSWSLNRYVIQPWWHFYEQFLPEQPASGPLSPAIPASN